MANSRGLLASPGLDGAPMKRVYFFPGQGSNDGLWTTYPLDVRDRHWNSDPSTRDWVLQRMMAAHVNTVVASSWSNMPQWSPMEVIREHAAAAALVMGEGENADLLDRLAADLRLPLDRPALDAALANRQAFTGAAGSQVDAIVAAVHDVVSRYPQAAKDTPGEIV